MSKHRATDYDPDLTEAIDAPEAIEPPQPETAEQPLKLASRRWFDEMFWPALASNVMMWIIPVISIVMIVASLWGMGVFDSDDR